MDLTQPLSSLLDNSSRSHGFTFQLYNPVNITPDPYRKYDTVLTKLVERITLYISGVNPNFCLGLIKHHNVSRSIL